MNNWEHMQWHKEHQKDVLNLHRPNWPTAARYGNAMTGTRGVRFSGGLPVRGRQTLLVLASGIHRIAGYLENLAGYSRALASNGCADDAPPCIQ
jgi:hypothetical protein